LFAWHPKLADIIMTWIAMRSRAFAHPFIGVVIAICAVYALIGLTPSSYAIVLKAIGVADPGLLFGTPRPIRSDEWTMWTPYVQITVNNGFDRFNATSPYGEDLRNFNALPLADWALAFKPQLWAFFFLPPAAAFSIMHAAVIAACLIGWYVTGLRFGFERPAASLFSITIFALPYTQLWWTTTGPAVAFLPWVLVAYMAPRSEIVRLVSVAYASAAFSLSHTYVPFICTLTFAAVVIMVAFKRDALRFRSLIAGGIGAFIGCGSAALYLWEPMQVMMATVYPGNRTSVGGGGLPHSFILANLFPHFISDGRTAFYWNDLEIATGGSYAIFLALVLLDYRKLLHRLQTRDPQLAVIAARIAILAVGTTLILGWWLLPIPSYYAVPLQWNALPPQRLAFAFGLLCHLIVFILVINVGLVAPPWRCIAATAVIIAAAALSKLVLWQGHIASLVFDLFILLPFVAVFLLLRRTPRFGLAVIACATLSNAILFISYNPGQRAGPIFAKHDTAIMRELAERQRNNPHHWLVESTFPGSVLNGLGFRAITQFLIAPQLAFFRQRFPELSDADFNYVFNRFAHIDVAPNINRPSTPYPDVIQVPAQAFE
jgi:hypothetical protein